MSVWFLYGEKNWKREESVKKEQKVNVTGFFVGKNLHFTRKKAFPSFLWKTIPTYIHSKMCKVTS